MPAGKPEPAIDADVAQLDSREDFLRSFQRLIGEIFRLNGQLLATADRLSKDLDVSTARWQVIAVIRSETLTVAGISRRLGLTRQSVQRTANALRDQGMVEFRDNPDHRTSPLIRLTKHGEQTMKVLLERQRTLTGHFTDDLNLTVEELNEISTRLRMMREHANARGKDIILVEKSADES